MIPGADLDDVLRAIHGGRPAAELESQHLDFRLRGRSLDDTVRSIVEAVLCFANADGGLVVVGVANRPGGPVAFVGSGDLDPRILQRRIYELTVPPLVCDVRHEQRFGAEMLLVSVPRSIEIHADSQGRAPRRIGTDCFPMSPIDQARLREERLGIDPSAKKTSRDTAEADPRAIAAARARLSASTDPGRRQLADLGALDLLTAIGATTKDGLFVRAGELLFCGPQADEDTALLYQYRTTPGGEPAAVERLAPPLILAFGRAIELVLARRTLTPVNLPGGQQIQVEDFPELAVREAIANGVIHRDLHLRGPVGIEHSPAVFVVTSPGPLVGGVTPENIITHPSAPRNPRLASIARRLGLAEEVGRGVDRMYREMIRAGRGAPLIETAPDIVRVTLTGGAPNTQVARYVGQLPAAERDDTDTLLVILTMLARRTVTAESVAPILQRRPEEAEAVLRRLTMEGAALLEPTRESRARLNPTYRLTAEALRALGSAVGYSRRTVDEIDRKVIAHVTEYGRVTNRTLQNMLDVRVSRARQILADLVEREILVKISTQQRGPGVEYGPGPRFPARRRGSP